jgi:hypothetical protein
MCGGRQCQNLFRRVANEKLLAGNAKTFASVPCVDFGSASVKPSPISLESRVLRFGLCQLFLVGYFFHDQGDLPESYHRVLLDSMRFILAPSQRYNNRGMASLGLILTVGVTCCMLTALVFLPALFCVMGKRQTVNAEPETLAMVDEKAA